jgi:signal transduction histidine kinase
MMRHDQPRQPNDQPPNHAARRPWGVLLVALALIFLSAAQLAYRFTLPTDGWAVLSSEDLDHPDWIYLANLVGTPSGLQRDDQLLAVAGTSVRGLAGTSALDPPPSWVAGQTTELRVLRQGRAIDLAVPIVQWIPAALVRMQLVGPEMLVGVLGGLILTALAIYTLWQRPEAPAARPLLLLGATFLAIQISHLLPDGLSVQFNRLASYAHMVFGFLLFGTLLGPSLLAFTLHFPRTKDVVQRHPWLGRVPYGLGLLVGAALLTGQAPSVGWLATVGMLMASLVSLVHAGITQRDAVSRAQLQWAGCGLILGVVLMLLVYPAASGMVAQPFLAQLMGAGFQIGFTVIGVALAIAVLRYRLFDIELVINRALVYATLTAGVIAVYVLVVGYLGWLFHTEANLALSLIATGIIAVGFAPAQQLVQRSVNRLLYGEREEPYHVLTRLGQQLETAAAPSAVLAQAAETVGRALKLPYVAIAHQEQDRPRLLAVYGQAPANVTHVPLTYAGAAVGTLIVAPRDPYAPLSPADQRLLTELARPIGVVAHAAALGARLEHARLRLVTERGEARRRLGSDLHDRIGHQLTGVTRQVEQALRVARDDPARMQILLADINQQLVAVTGQVRDLAHQLFPPELAVLGLIEAIRERALAHTHLAVQMVAPQPLPELPAEIEAAVYAITLEALTNVDKHAGASRCTIRIQIVADGTWQVGRQLELVICDDGAGLPAGGTQGLGLLSMQARAAEVGGTCRIESPPRQGTSVVVRIPYDSTTE